MRSVVIPVRPVFTYENKYYFQVFLQEYLYNILINNIFIIFLLIKKKKKRTFLVYNSE